MEYMETGLTLLNLDRPEPRANALENPATSLSAPASWLFDWLADGPPSASGISVSQMSAMRNTTVFACRRILTESVASLPVYVYERTKTGRKIADETPLYDLLANTPNPYMTSTTFFEALMFGVTDGNGYAEIVWNEAGQPIELWPRMYTKTVPMFLNNKLVYKTTDTPSGEPRIIRSEDMIHVPALAMEGLVGLSPIQQAKQAIGLALATERFGSTFFGNGSRPSGILSTDAKLDDKVRAANKASWQAANSGANANGTAVLDGGLKWTPTVMSNEDSQFLETRGYQKLDIAQIYRVPPYMLGVFESGMAKANVEQQSQDFITNTLRPYIIRIEQELQRKLFPKIGRNANKYFCEFNINAILRADYLTRQKGYAIGRQWGYLCADDCREGEGKNPLPDGQGTTFMTPVNMVSATEMQNADGKDESDVEIDVQDDSELNADGASRSVRVPAEYMEVLRDAFARAAHMDHQDLATLTRTLKPALGSIARYFEHISRRTLRISGAKSDREAVTANYLKSLEKKKLTAETIPAEIERCSRFLLVNISKDLAAQHSLALLEKQ